MLFDKLKDNFSGAIKAQADRASGSYCTKPLGPDALQKVRWFRQVEPEDVLQGTLLEKNTAAIFSRKAMVFGKEVDLTYRIKKQGWQVLPETIIVDPAGKFLSRVVNKSNCEHAIKIWNLLGRVNPAYVPIDWHLDFFSGYRFDSTLHARNINPVPKAGVRIDSAFQFGRLYHLTWMALMFKASEKEVYAQEILGQLLDFMSLNPPCFGLHWFAPEEVAVRSVNVILSLNLIKDWLVRQPYGEESIHEILKYLYSCGEYLHAAEPGKNIGSFTDVFALSALLTVALLLEDVFAEARIWKSAAHQALIRQVPRYILSDGTNPEGSTFLHYSLLGALAFAICFYCASQKEGPDKATIIKNFGEDFFDCFRKMSEVLFFLTKPNGRLPQIGDNPSLYFYKLNPALTLESYPLLYLLSVLCDEPLWVITDFQQKEDSFVDITFLLGKPKGRRIAAFNGTAAADIVSRSFISSGWYLLRAKDIYCFINAGALEKSAHRNFMHNDKLSFELMLNGEEVVVDPGTYTFYDLKERDAFRTTAAHAALVVRDEEQNMFGRSKVLDFGEEETGFWFEAEYDGYRQSGFIQRRRIELIKAKRELKVTDILVGNISKVRCINNVVLSPSLDILRLNIQPQGNININDSAWYSPEYGIKIPTKRLEISALSYTISIINKAEDIPRP